MNRVAIITSAFIVCLGIMPSAAVAQRSLYSATYPTGTVGQMQLLKRLPHAGYYQPVEVRVPQRAQVGIAQNGVFTTPQPQSIKCGLLIGQVYRYKITNIPNQPGLELYPSVELVNRLYPPAGKAWKYPIPIHITQEELEMASRGQFVIRVVYLENPRRALPALISKDEQRVFQIHEKEDPLQSADRLGRPLAIIRIGSRVPDLDVQTGRFNFGCPPWLASPAQIERGVRQSRVIHHRPIPRIYR